MSEQLRPRSPPEDSLDRIPPLKHVSAGRLASQKQQQQQHHQHRQPIQAHSPATHGHSNGHSNGHSEVSTPPQTKLSELELVNDLLRSRVAQLEKAEAVIRESELSLRRQLEEARSERDHLRESEQALHRQMANVCNERDRLRARVDELERSRPDEQTRQSPVGDKRTLEATTQTQDVTTAEVKRIKVSDII